MAPLRVQRAVCAGEWRGSLVESDAGSCTTVRAALPAPCCARYGSMNEVAQIQDSRSVIGRLSPSPTTRYFWCWACQHVQIAGRFLIINVSVLFLNTTFHLFRSGSPSAMFRHVSDFPICYGSLPRQAVFRNSRSEGIVDQGFCSGSHDFRNSDPKQFEIELR